MQPTNVHPKQLFRDVNKIVICYTVGCAISNVLDTHVQHAQEVTTVQQVDEDGNLAVLTFIKTRL